VPQLSAGPLGGNLKMARPIARYIRLTEETNALDYLKQAGEHIERTEEDSSAWKWVVLCLHSALYGFAICTVHGTDYDRVTYIAKSGQKKLIGFDEALKRAQDPNWMIQTMMSKPLKITDDQRRSILILKKEFRDKFEHFIPKSWSIEIHGFPQIAMDVLQVIRFLALDTGNYVLFNQTHRRNVRSIVFKAMRTLKNSRLHQESELIK
jgi:hypothetical protein